tara:strand:- start:53 stop:388 length:336 start_codon:yes stop_codon:yes gene_type:complete
MKEHKNLFDLYVRRVCAAYVISEQEMFSRTKNNDVTEARQMLFLLCYGRPMRVSKITQFVNDRGLSFHHTAVLYSIDRGMEKLIDNEDFREVVKRCSKSNLILHDRKKNLT